MLALTWSAPPPAARPARPGGSRGGPSPPPARTARHKSRQSGVSSGGRLTSFRPRLPLYCGDVSTQAASSVMPGIPASSSRSRPTASSARSHTRSGALASSPTTRPTPLLRRAVHHPGTGSNSGRNRVSPRTSTSRPRLRKRMPASPRPAGLNPSPEHPMEHPMEHPTEHPMLPEDRLLRWDPRRFLPNSLSGQWEGGTSVDPAASTVPSQSPCFQSHRLPAVPWIPCRIHLRCEAQWPNNAT